MDDPIFKLLGQFGQGLMVGLGNQAAHDWHQETQEHPDEDFGTHIAHTAGRLLGIMISGNN